MTTHYFHEIAFLSLFVFITMNFIRIRVVRGPKFVTTARKNPALLDVT